MGETTHDDLLDPPSGSSKADPAPRYCPRCGRAADRPGRLCDHCGETLRAQGYCGVCESFWQRPVGTPCPKHEIPLEEAPTSDPRREALAGGPWVTVKVFSDTQSATAPRLRLEAEGIPTFVEGERMGGRAMYHVATGGVRLLVPQALAADARVILSQRWAEPTEIDGVDDAWDGHDEPAVEPPAEAGHHAEFYADPRPLVSRRHLLEALAVLTIGGLLWMLTRPVKSLQGIGRHRVPGR